jgi:hypothetical protein
MNNTIKMKNGSIFSSLYLFRSVVNYHFFILFYTNTFLIRIIFILVFIIYSLYFNDPLLCEDHPNGVSDNNPNVEQTQSSKDLEDSIFYFERYYESGTKHEMHARVYY